VLLGHYLVGTERVELSSNDYQSFALPLSYAPLIWSSVGDLNP
jgi:hypothetical protein